MNARFAAAPSPNLDANNGEIAVNRLHIPRINKSQFSQDFFPRRLPAILTDLLFDWPAMGQWNPTYLAHILKRRTVSVAIAKAGLFSYNESPDHNQCREYRLDKMHFDDAVKEICSPNDRSVYIMQSSIPENYPELLPEIRKPEWIPSEEEPVVNLWLGNNTRLPVHFDGSNNFIAQLYGDKQFILFPPQDADCLYQYSSDAAASTFGAVNIEAPNLERYPKYSGASPIAVTLAPGEALFIPAFWWHHVRSLGIAISVSMWWEADLEQWSNCASGWIGLDQCYQGDRLLSFKRRILTPRKRTVWTAVKSLLTDGNVRWAGALLVGLFDEQVGRLCDRAGIARRSGCSMKELDQDLRDAAAKLGKIGACDSEQLHMIEAVAECAEMVASGCEQAAESMLHRLLHLGRKWNLDRTG